MNPIEIARTFENLIDRRDLAGCLALFGPDAVYNGPGAGANLKGEGEIGPFFQAFFTAFPDGRFTVDTIFGDADAGTVCVEWTYCATMTGEFGTIAPTGRALAAPGVHVFYIADGLIHRVNAHWDATGMLTQLGISAA